MVKNKRIPIPLPVRGLNTVEPFNLSVDSLQARELTNYYFKNGKLFMRPAVTEHAYSAGLPADPVWFDATTIGVGGQMICLLTDGTYYRLDTGALLGNIGGAANSSITSCKHGDLDMLIGARRPRIKTSPFTAYTNVTGVIPDPANIPLDNITSACSHKSRLYYSAGTVINYGSVAQMRGTMPIANVFDVQSLLDNQSILRMFSASGQSGTANDAVFVIFGNNGKILIYSGDSPGSANWSLIGNYNLPAPGGVNAFLEIDGDIFVLAKSYCYWFKDVLLGGAQSAYENSPSKDIHNFWQGLYPRSCWYNQELDLIVSTVVGGATTNFQIQNWADYGNTTAVTDFYYGWLIYHKRLKCFSFWAMPPTVTACGVQEFPVDATGFTAGFYMLGQKAILKLDPTKCIDSNTTQGTIPIETSWKTPYFAPFEGIGNKVNAVRVWFENTISGYFEKARAIFDYSDYNVSLGWYTQSTVTQVNPANYGDGKDDGAAVASNQYHPLIGASGNGGGVSFQFTQKAKSGSSTTQNQSIYAATAYVEEAGELW